MRDDPLGSLNGQFRTSRPQAVTLFVVAGVLAVLGGIVFAIDDRLHNLLPVVIVLIGSVIYFLWWGATLAVHVLDVREHGVSLRFLTRRMNIRFDEIEGVGVRQRTRNGLPGSYSGIWLKRRDGSMVRFRLESNVQEACNQIERALSET